MENDLLVEYNSISDWNIIMYNMVYLYSIMPFK
jgi:hypothetical protein